MANIHLQHSDVGCDSIPPFKMDKLLLHNAIFYHHKGQQPLVPGIGNFGK